MRSHPSGLAMQRCTALSPARQRGVATLVVVMVLFFIIALVAAYTSRNMIFEQRTSANQYRSTQAFEAAEAGVQWTLAMLNSGRIDDNCQPTTDLSKSTFRARYIDKIDAAGSISLRVRSDGTPLMPTCAFDAATNRWVCLCPADAAAAVPAVGGSAAKPMFRIQLQYIPDSARRDSVRIVSAGCSRPDIACIVATTAITSPAAPAGDAMAVVTALVTLRSALSTPPAAAITARGNINAGTGPLSATNSDRGSNGVTFRAGGVIAGNTAPTSLPGTPGSASVAELDPALSGLVALPPLLPTTGDRLFSVVFTMAPSLYVQQPQVAEVVMDCSATCNAATINAMAAKYPGRALWLNGNLNIDGDIGSALPGTTPENQTLLASEVPASGPVLLVVTGTAQLSSGNFFGVLYSRQANWNFGAGSTAVTGALISEGNIANTTAANLSSVNLDADVLTRLRTRHGAFVRVPGGWKDF